MLMAFCISNMCAQMTDLAKLSRGKFYSSDVIKDKKNNIKGYFLLFETDKVAKETYELEYVVLDENLTKVTNGFITEMKYESWFVNADRIKISVTLEKNRLLLELCDYIKGIEYFKRYRLLDIRSNVLSEPFMFNKDSLKVNPKFDRKMSNLSNNMGEEMFFYNGVGLIANSTTLSKRHKLTECKLIHYDENFNEVWRLKYDNIKDKKLNDFTYLNSDDDVIVMFNHYMKNNNVKTYLNELSLFFIDSETGTLKKEFAFPNPDENTYRVVDCEITDDKIYVMGNYAQDQKYGFVNDAKNKGLYKFVFDKNTGKLVDSRYLLWENIGKGLDIDKNGKVKKEGHIYIHDMLPLSNGKVIAVAETFNNDPIITNNMYLFELTDKFTVSQVFEITKFRNKFPGTGAYSGDIKKYGLFDFIDYQDLGDDEYLFFLNDNEKNSRNRNKSTLYGIVSYSDGKFNRQTLDLKTETSTIFANNAKKGYMMLVENFDEENKPTQIRLEKINF